MPQLRTLDLSHNELSFLPDDCSVLSHVHTLNLVGNPIVDVSRVLTGLRVMASLRRLQLTVRCAADEEALVQALPSLTTFNGVLLDGAASTSHLNGSGEATAFAGWTPEDAAAATQLFAATTADAELPPPHDEYVDYLRRVEMHVTCLVAAEADPLQQEGEVLKAHRLLLEFCFKVLARQVARHSAADGEKVAATLAHSMDLLDRYDGLWRRMAKERNATVDLMKADMRRAIHEIETLMSLPAAPAGPRAAARHADASGLSAAAPPKGSSAVGAAGRVTPQRSARSTGARTPSSRAKGYASSCTTPGRSVGTPRLASPQTRARKTLSFKQLKELVEDIYASKSKYDLKCRESHLPRETMEQHMYTYFNQRFGLKDLTVEWATAVMEGVKRYAPEDNDIAVFGRILRNEVDEEFRFVQCKVRETIRELLRAFLDRQNPLKSSQDVAALVEKAVQGGLREAEWEYIVGYMYNTEDAAALTSLIRKQLYFLFPTRKVTSAKSLKSATAPLLPYVDFIRFLLNFQLAGHERFLKPFVKLFRKYDADQDGIINGSDFRSIALALDTKRTERQVEDMLRHIDPLGSQIITFSECVSFFSEDLFRMQAN
ncbi:hypothetical protein STCU_06409 [Strigomonas culicis]|uniref:EF-hand domain-containing protein n=1 Tax=Strigomonas culicis TaxID=28005 RepID=S9UAE2_9TRYP|nr:hypothetical protein STCU_06409 [Strigomonas culicis]|eukprot:EPY25923.1 hypothetical protein STCU_06409 [Strigomonas culicis]